MLNLHHKFNMMKNILKVVLIAIAYQLNVNILYAQTDTVSKITYSGYLEAYYSYDFGNPQNHTRPSFFYSFNRHNETNLNIGFIKAKYSSSTVRANLALMTGTYAHYNLSSEQSVLQHVYEANVGFKIAKNHEIWLDAGIMPSHIGFESAIGKDCWNLTRSILADNSPYYEAGAKIGYTSKNEKLYFAAMYLNGWQRIQKIVGNQTPAFGTQLTYKPNSKVSLNYSTYLGNEQPDSNKLWRNFHNFYGQFQFNDKLGFITGFDIGAQQTNKNESATNVWYSQIVIVRYSVNDKFIIAARAEYYEDKGGVIISTATPNGFQTYGYSLNFDYLPADNMMLRIEGRGLNSKDEIFMVGNKANHTNFFITSSLAVSF
jgi:hypothetical protein